MTEEFAAGDSVLVLGLGIYGQAAATALVKRDISVIGVDDRPRPGLDDFASELGIRYVPEPDAETLGSMLGGADGFMPSPGVPEWHGAFSAAARLGVPILSEFDLARWWDDRPIVAVTGTDGKTTVTMLTTDMLRASGVSAAAVGNTEVPLVTALGDPEIAVFVVEASSFRLASTERFEPRAAAWLNFGPDHLDVHTDLASYERAKAKIWATLPAEGLAVASHDDPVVMSHMPADRRAVTVGVDQGDHRTVDGWLTVGGTKLVQRSEMRRSFEHDVTNALSAATLALEVGATVEGVRQAIVEHRGLPHRIQHVASIGGIDLYNDSKATVPHAVLAAISSFDSVVLIAGGRNKGLDLGALADRADRVSSVVAIGESAGDVAAAFGNSAPVAFAGDMDEAVRIALDAATPGDVVLLSPGCASYDAYTSYQARGDDFIRAVTALEP